MDRREFFATSAAAAVTGIAAAATPSAATPSAASSAAAREPTRRVVPHFGYAAITWGGDDVQAIDDIAAVGYRGIQLRASAVTRWGANPAVLRQRLADRALTFAALSSGSVTIEPAGMQENMALHLRHAAFLRDAGGLYLQVVDERPQGRRPTADDFQRMGERLSEIGRRVSEFGVALGYHNHMGNLGQAPEEVARVLEAADPRYVRLELDTAHYQAAGGNPVDAIRQHADRLLFLHLKDVQQPVPGRPANAYRFVELGEGRVPLVAVLAELARIRFDGWAIVELDGVPDPARTPRDCARISKHFLESHGYTV